MVADYDFVCLFLCFLFGGVARLALDDFDLLTDAGELVADYHALLLLLVLLVQEIDHLIEVQVLVDFLQRLGCLLCYRLDVLDYLKGVLEALVVEGFDFTLYLLGLVGNYLWTPICSLFAF